MKSEQSESRKNVTSGQSDFRVHTGKLPEARENTSGQARLVLGLLSDWLRGWHEFPEPITERDEAIPKKKLESLFALNENLGRNFRG